jgi:hypothetical protein
MVPTLVFLVIGCGKDPPPDNEPEATTAVEMPTSEDSGSTGLPVHECSIDAAESNVLLASNPCDVGRFFIGGPAGVPIGDVACTGQPPQDGSPAIVPITVSTPDGDLPALEYFPAAEGGTVVAAFRTNLEDWACPQFVYSINCMHEEACPVTWELIFHDEGGGFSMLKGRDPGPDYAREFYDLPKVDIEVQIAVTWPEDEESRQSVVVIDPKFAEFLHT